MQQKYPATQEVAALANKSSRDNQKLSRNRDTWLLSPTVLLRQAIFTPPRGYIALNEIKPRQFVGWFMHKVI
jgi:hypothetical protein